MSSNVIEVMAVAACGDDTEIAKALVAGRAFTLPALTMVSPEMLMVPAPAAGALTLKTPAGA